MNELSSDTILSVLVGAFLILVGAVSVFNVNGALAILQFFTILAPPLLLVGYFFGFWLAVVGIVIVIVFLVTRRINKDSVGKN